MIYLIGGKRNGELVSIDIDETLSIGGRFCVEHETEVPVLERGVDRDWISPAGFDLYDLMPPMRIGDTVYYYGKEISIDLQEAFVICKGLKKEKYMKKAKVLQMFYLQRQREQLEKECNSLGEEIFGESYQGCDLSEDVLTLYDDCGHDSECDEYYFNNKGEEV